MIAQNNSWTGHSLSAHKVNGVTRSETSISAPPVTPLLRQSIPEIGYLLTTTRSMPTTWPATSR
jgi:hypothetical protein